MGVQTFDEHSLVSTPAFYDLAAGTAEQSLLEGTPNGARLDVCLASNTDAIDHVLVLSYYGGGQDNSIGSVNIPAGSGVGGVASVDVIAALFPTNVSSFPVAANYAIFGHLEVAATVAGSVQVTAIGGAF